MIKIGEYINYQDGWRLLTHRYLKTDNIWKVTWQRDGYKQTKGNQRKENYKWHELPRQLMRMYTPDGKLLNRFNGTIRRIKENINQKNKVRQALKQGGKLKVPTGDKYQAEIPNHEPGELIDEKKMKLIEAQQVYKAFECKKRKRDEMETPTQEPKKQTTITKEQMDEVKKVAQQCESEDFRQSVREYYKEGSSKKPIDLT